MNGTEIGVFKGKSMVVIILPLDEVARENFGPRFMTEIGESAPLCLQEFPYRLFLRLLWHYEDKSVCVFKSGPSELRKAFFLRMDCLI